MPTLSERLAELRELAGLQNRELDRLAGLRAGHSWLLEHREAPNPELRTLGALAKALGCSVGYLAANEGRRPTPKTIHDAVAAARVRVAKKTGKDAA